MTITIKNLIQYSILFTFFIFSAIHGRAQNVSHVNLILAKYIDSLNEAADTLCLHKVDNGGKLASKALELSIKYNYNKGMGEAYHNLGLINFRRNNEISLDYFLKAKAQFEKEVGTIEVMAFNLNNISRTFLEIIQYDSAFYYAKKAISFADQKINNPTQQKKWIMYGLGAAANALDGLSKFDSATIYILQAIKIAEQLQNNKMLEVYFKLMSTIQSKLGNDIDAIAYLIKGIQYIENDLRATTIAYATLGSYYAKINDCVNAYRYADSSITLGKVSNVYNSIGRNFVTYGECKMKEKKFFEALKLFKTGYELAKKYNNSKSSLSKIELRIAEAYESIDSFTLAISYYSKALDTERGSDYLISNTYFKMSQLATKLKDYSTAYLYLKKYSEFKDTVYNNDKIKMVYDLTMKFETEKKEKKLASLEVEKKLNQLMIEKQIAVIESVKKNELKKELELKNLKLESERSNYLFQLKENELINKESDIRFHIQEKKLNQLTIQNQRKWIFIILSSFLIMSLVSLLLFNRFKYKKQFQNQQALTDLRLQISQDLHDDLGATLSGISMYSHLAKHQFEMRDLQKLNESIFIIQESTGELIEKVRDITWLVSPEIDSYEKFITCIHEMAERMSKAKQVQFESNIDLHFPHQILSPDIRKNIYLFFKEAINNALKYSESSNIKISIIQRANHSIFSVYDYGVGFSPEAIKKGNGLINMRKRAELLGGILNINSSKNAGTELSLNLIS